MNHLKKGSINFLKLTSSNSQKRKLLSSLDKVLSSGNFILGKEVAQFEKEFAKYLGSKFCIGVGNGLEALQISLMALGVSKGDEVITTPLSAVATTLSILAVGAKPVFVDVDNNGLLDISKVEKTITSKTKAILPVHLYGNPSSPLELKKLSTKKGLFFIEDAAQAHGSTFQGKKLGTFGDLGCFSFYPTKNLGAIGDGGAIVTNNKKLAKICYQIRDYGQSSKYVHTRFGLNSRLDEVQAAFLRVKLQDLDKENRKRQSIAKKYISLLSKINEVTILGLDNLTKSNFHLFVIKAKKRDTLIKYLNKVGIKSSVHYPKIIPDQPFLNKKYPVNRLPVAKNFVKEILSLPCHPKMNMQEVYFISNHIINFYKP